MGNTDLFLPRRGPAGCALAPIDMAEDSAALRLCVFVRTDPKTAANPLVLLRAVPGSSFYLGAVCDAQGWVQERVEICVQTMELRDLTFSNFQERLANCVFDQRWRGEFERHLAQRREAVIATGMELENPRPLLIQLQPSGANSPWLPVEVSPWCVCKNDALLESFGLQPYSTSPYRYLHQPDSAGPKTFLASAPDAPTNAHVQGADRLNSDPGGRVVFNPHAGLMHVTRFSPLSLEEYLQVLEGQPWNGEDAGGRDFFRNDIYARLQAWSASPKGLPFLLHGLAASSESLCEILFLKLALLRNLFTEVRACVKAQQLPLLNLSPASFRVSLPEVGDQFPALWSARAGLVKPSQAYPLKIKSTEQKYFIRLGRIEPSPFLPEGLGAHSFGIGSVRLRSVLTETDGIVLDGTLVAENYLRLDARDLIWFELPIGEPRSVFYAQVYADKTVGPREVRFRTVPARLSEAVIATLKQATVFQKAPYEIWPLLSSPCDMYSLGVIAVRILLANSHSQLPEVLDEVLSLSGRIGDALDAASALHALLEQDPRLRERTSPHVLMGAALAPEQARRMVPRDLWLDTVALVLRLFPGFSKHSYCANFGDVSPLALETVFDGPIQELETLVSRFRSVLTPSLAANEEIATVLLEQLAALR